jgi:hypothetical protein
LGLAGFDSTAATSGDLLHQFAMKVYIGDAALIFINSDQPFTVDPQEPLGTLPLGTDPRLEELASRMSKLEQVEAVILGGSIPTGLADERSDYDLYVYTRQPVEITAREAILRPRASRIELQRDFWEWEDTWIERDGTKFEMMYRGCGHAEQEVESRLHRCKASVGYTTCVLHTLAHGHVLADPNGWFEGMQQRVRSTPYPDDLFRAIVSKNFPVLGPIISSYEDQIRSAFARQDLVSLNHRTTAWLASYFDILFAGNRQYHPGEKRLLVHAAQLPTLPTKMVDDVTEACLRACSLENCIANHLKETREKLATWLEAHGVSVS